jgi:hypothetical protein
MDRRNFIIKSGTVITATALSGLFGCAPEQLILGENKKAKRPSGDDFTQPILKAIAIGVNTANPHNTQPWKFKILSDTKAILCMWTKQDYCRQQIRRQDKSILVAVVFWKHYA